MDFKSLKNFEGKTIHFVGIGGCSMSGLALILKNIGYHVTGSDMNESVFTKKLIEDGINGFIVKRDYETIKQALIKIVDEQEKLSEMGKAIRQKMEQQFNWNNLIHQWTDFFKYALELYRLKQQGNIK